MVHIHAESKNFNASGHIANDIQVKLHCQIWFIILFNELKFVKYIVFLVLHLLVLEQVDPEVKVEEETRGNMALLVSSVLEIDL